MRRSPWFPTITTHEARARGQQGVRAGRGAQAFPASQRRWLLRAGWQTDVVDRDFRNRALRDGGTCVALPGIGSVRDVRADARMAMLAGIRRRPWRRHRERPRRGRAVQSVRQHTARTGYSAKM
jgi:hypothetical protein